MVPWWVRPGQVPANERMALDLAIKYLQSIDQRLKMATARFEATRAEYVAITTAMQAAIPYLRGYLQLKEQAAEAAQSDEMLKDVAKARALLEAAIAAINPPSTSVDSKE